MVSNYEILARLLLVTLLSGLIGFERGFHGRAAGLRTHILVGLGSAIMMLTSMYMFEMYKGVAVVDPSRIAAQVVTGMGFLGAGTILRWGATIRGLTTAASMWSVAGVGLAVGCGFYFAAIATTALVLIALIVFSKMEAAFELKGAKRKEGEK